MVEEAILVDEFKALILIPIIIATVIKETGGWVVAQRKCAYDYLLSQIYQAILKLFRAYHVY